MTTLSIEIAALIEQEKLPRAFQASVQRFYMPIAKRIAQSATLNSVANKNAIFVGINGAQGTGKSTLTRFLALVLEKAFDKRCAWLSIDDLYLTKSARNKLSLEVHPLLATRGVPGTHDMPLALTTIDQLQRATTTSKTPIPAFCKANDDRLPLAEWRIFQGKPDVIILEGWCVATTAQKASQLLQPINAFEQDYDSDGSWRDYVNTQLGSDYQRLFSQLDMLVFMKVPDWESVFKWRLLQEEKLKAKVLATGGDASGVMSEDQVRTFVQHYERLTRHNLDTLHSRADFILQMERDHALASLTGPALD